MGDAHRFLKVLVTPQNRLTPGPTQNASCSSARHGQAAVGHGAGQAQRHIQKGPGSQVRSGFPLRGRVSLSDEGPLLQWVTSPLMPGALSGNDRPVVLRCARQRPAGQAWPREGTTAQVALQGLPKTRGKAHVRGHTTEPRGQGQAAHVGYLFRHHWGPGRATMAKWPEAPGLL